MQNKCLYFSDTEAGAVELAASSIPMPNAEFAAKFPGVKGMKYDGFAKRRRQESRARRVYDASSRLIHISRKLLTHFPPNNRCPT